MFVDLTDLTYGDGGDDGDDVWNVLDWSVPDMIPMLPNKLPIFLQFRVIFGCYWKMPNFNLLFQNDVG